MCTATPLVAESNGRGIVQLDERRSHSFLSRWSGKGSLTKLLTFRQNSSSLSSLGSCIQKKILRAFVFHFRRYTRPVVLRVTFLNSTSLGKSTRSSSGWCRCSNDLSSRNASGNRCPDEHRPILFVYPDAPREGERDADEKIRANDEPSFHAGSSCPLWIRPNYAYAFERQLHRRSTLFFCWQWRETDPRTICRLIDEGTLDMGLVEHAIVLSVEKWIRHLAPSVAHSKPPPGSIRKFRCTLELVRHLLGIHLGVR